MSESKCKDFLKCDQCGEKESRLEDPIPGVRIGCRMCHGEMVEEKSSIKESE